MPATRSSTRSSTTITAPPHLRATSTQYRDSGPRSPDAGRAARTPSEPQIKEESSDTVLHEEIGDYAESPQSMFTDFSIAEEQYDAQASGTEANRTMYPSPASLLLASGASEGPSGERLHGSPARSPTLSPDDARSRSRAPSPVDARSRPRAPSQVTLMPSADSTSEHVRHGGNKLRRKSVPPPSLPVGSEVRLASMF